MIRSFDSIVTAPRRALLITAVAALSACGKPAPTPVPAPAKPDAAAADGRERPPAPGEPRRVTIPAAAERQLANGLRVLVVERHGSPLVTTAFTVLSGGEMDPPALAGLADFTATLLTQGTKTRSAPQIAQAAEALGGAISAAADWNATRIGITVTTPKAADALALVADVVRNPAFANAEIERQRAQALDSLSVTLSQPRSLATLIALRAAYGDAPYGHPRSGTPASLARIQRADLEALHHRIYRPDNAVLIFAGDIDADEALAMAERSFGSWARPSTPLDARPQDAALAKSTTRVVAIDLPGAGQAAVVAVQRIPPRGAPDYFAGLVTNAVLGGGYSARLNSEIRIKRGLSYGASSRLQALRDGGALLASAQTKNESADEVVALIRTELARLSNEPVPDTELGARKASLIGTFARGLETTEGLAEQLSSLVALGIDPGEINRVIDGANAVTAQQIRAYAAEHLPADTASVVIIGDGKAFVYDLRKTYPAAVVIPAAQLDLDHPALDPPATGSTAQPAAPPAAPSTAP